MEWTKRNQAYGTMVIELQYTAITDPAMMCSLRESQKVQPWAYKSHNARLTSGLISPHRLHLLTAAFVMYMSSDH